MDAEVIRYKGVPSISPSVTGEGAMYYDINLGKFQCSEDGASFVDCVGGGDITGVIAGTGLSGGGLSGDVTLSTSSSDADFLSSGALTCGAGTQGKMQVHTTPLQYCDNAATPALQYAAYGNSSGDALGVQADSVALTTDTTGNYVASLGTGSEGATFTLSGTGTELPTTVSPTITGINLGNVDTTLSRTAAGRINVESKNVCLDDGTDCPPVTSLSDVNFTHSNGTILRSDGTDLVGVTPCSGFGSCRLTQSALSKAITWSPITAPSTPPWKTVLISGRTSSGNNPQLTTTDHLEFSSSAVYLYSPTTGDLKVVYTGNYIILGSTNGWNYDSSGVMTKNGTANYDVASNTCAFRSEADSDACLAFETTGGTGYSFRDLTGADAVKVYTSGELEVNDTNTGLNMGTDLCIGSNNRLCVCGSCK